MAKAPRVPASAFGHARLPRQIKRRLKRQADRAAQRVYGPEIEALQAQKAQVRRQYRRDVRSAEGAISATQEAIEGESLKGLHGSARRQVAQELARSSRDVAQALPFMTAEALDARRSGLQDVRNDILSTRIEQTQTAARSYNDSLKSARTKAAEYLADKQDNRADRRETQRDHAKTKRQARGDLKTAVRTAINLLATGALNEEKPQQGVPWSPQAVKHYGTEDAAWAKFEELLSGQEGVDGDTAHAAVVALRKRLSQQAGPPNPQTGNVGPPLDVRDVMGG